MYISSYCSVGYLGIFLPAAVLLYAILPRKARPFWLILASLMFFWAISGGLVIYLLTSAAVTYLCGIAIESRLLTMNKALDAAPKAERKQITAVYEKKFLLFAALGISFNLILLTFFKYLGFFSLNINYIFSLLGVNFSLHIPKIIAPIGISFYTLQALAYIFDVYRGKIRADRNFPRLLLFMSFFPSVMEGPICRYQDTAYRLWKGSAISYKSLAFGCQRIAFGVFKKMVIADRLNISVKTIFERYDEYGGVITFVGAVLYTIQLYCEFSGTMDMVIGSGEIFGVKLPENFRHPFFSKSISEFWKRWHITLGTWFKDYIFYPVSMSDKMKKLTLKSRKKLGKYYGPVLVGGIALFCVWLLNGLWHGAGWNYIFFGMYHFVLILSGNLITPLAKKIHGLMHINPEKNWYRVFCMVRTFLLVCIGEMFFRAESLTAGLAMFKNIVTDFSLTAFTDGSFLSLGLDRGDLLISVLALMVVFAISYLSEKGVNIREQLSKKRIYVRWAVYYALVLSIVIFGAYGKGYIPIDPIYASF